MRRSLLCWQHCFKFIGNDRLRNQDGGFGTCCRTLVTVKLCLFRYWYTVIIYVPLILPNVVSFFHEKEGKRRFVIAFKLWLACVLSHLCHEHNSSGFWVFVCSTTFGHKACILVRSILLDNFYIEWAHIIIYINVRTWIQCIHRPEAEKRLEKSK